MRTDSREDRFAVYDLALRPELHLPRRILTNGDKDSPLCRRDTTLAVILSLSPFLPEWFTLGPLRPQKYMSTSLWSFHSGSPKRQGAVIAKVVPPSRVRIAAVVVVRADAPLGGRKDV